MALSEASCFGSTVIPKKNKSEFSRTRVNALYIYTNVLYYSMVQEMSTIGIIISFLYYLCTITTHKLMLSYNWDSQASQSFTFKYGSMDSFQEIL